MQPYIADDIRHGEIIVTEIRLHDCSLSVVSRETIHAHIDDVALVL